MALHVDKMFTEKNLPRLIIATPIIMVLLFAMMIIYFFIASQYSNFEQESLELEKEYVQTQKKILIDENTKVFDYIIYHRNVEKKEFIIILDSALKMVKQ